ncbi:MAG: ABC transporter ATP-binding protein [Gallionella sp.]|nr:ABC transporter ATP-binding protein [Gallionella sp.]
MMNQTTDQSVPTSYSPLATHQDASNIAISVRNVSKCYRVFDDQRARLLHAIWPKHIKGMQEIWALKDINFEIKRGEAVAIIGCNGGGKSTLLEILTGTLTPTGGKVKLNGRVSGLLELGSGFNPEYSGRDNVTLNGLLLGLSREEISNRFEEIEAFAEIGAAIDRPVKTYSSGMTMRLAFAVQVLCDPDILIVDEALSVGDFFFQQKCLSFIRELCAKGVTLLFVSHDMGTVRDICQRGIFLSKGCMGFDGGNLEAIRHYLQTASSMSADVPARATCAPGFEPTETGDSLKIAEPLWSLGSNEFAERQTRLAYLISVGIFDKKRNPITSTLMGSEIKIRVHYKSLCKDQVHVHLVIKNKYDQIVTAVGSYNLKVPAPVLDIEQEAIFELSIQLAIEAGDYVLCASLAQPSANRMAGIQIDETPWLGPFQVRWNYDEEVPPFYGMVGLKAESVFFTKAGNEG